MADEQGNEKEGKMRAELQKIMSQTRSNPEPIPYWGKQDNMVSQKMSMLFEGRPMLKTDSKEGSNITRVHYYCDNHRAVVADPDAFAMIVDEDGVTGVHAAAINGYLDTLRILIERGGANPFAQVRGRVDALQMARRRGHNEVLEYLSSFQGEAGAQKLIAISAYVQDRRNKLAEQLAQLEGDMSGFEDGNEELEQEEEVEEEEKKKTVEAVAEAREVALRASMKAIQKDVVKSVELIPRKIWRAEWAEIDDKRGVGYYPRKPLAEEELV
jgi:hypothetical protein